MDANGRHLQSKLSELASLALSWKYFSFCVIWGTQGSPFWLSCWTPRALIFPLGSFWFRMPKLWDYTSKSTSISSNCVHMPPLQVGKSTIFIQFQSTVNIPRKAHVLEILCYSVFSNAEVLEAGFPVSEEICVLCELIESAPNRGRSPGIIF